MRPAWEAETGGKFPQVPGHLGPRMPEAAGRSLQGRSPAQTLISDPGRESVSVLTLPTRGPLLQPPQDSNTAPLSGNLPVLPQKPQDPEASTATATAAVRGGQAALAAVAPRCRRKALLGGATRPLAPPTGLHCPREGDGRASCPRRKGQPGGGGPAVSARGPPTHQIIQGSDPS